MQGGTLRSTLHTRLSSRHNNKHQASQKHSCVSWWWVHNSPKHVEKINKQTKKNCAPSWFIYKIISGKLSQIHNSLSPASNTVFRAVASSVILLAHILPSSVEISMNFTSYTARIPNVVWLKSCKHCNVAFIFNLLKWTNHILTLLPFALTFTLYSWLFHSLPNTLPYHIDVPL